jgi:hypothetical protein
MSQVLRSRSLGLDDTMVVCGCDGRLRTVSAKTVAECILEEHYCRQIGMKEQTVNEQRELARDMYVVTV